MNFIICLNNFPASVGYIILQSKEKHLIWAQKVFYIKKKYLISKTKKKSRNYLTH